MCGYLESVGYAWKHFIFFRLLGHSRVKTIFKILGFPVTSKIYSPGWWKPVLIVGVPVHGGVPIEQQACPHLCQIRRW